MNMAKKTKILTRAVGAGVGGAAAAAQAYSHGMISGQGQYYA